MSEFSKEDLERKITLAAGDTAPQFSLENSDGVSISHPRLHDRSVRI